VNITAVLRLTIGMLLSISCAAFVTPAEAYPASGGATHGPSTQTVYQHAPVNTGPWTSPNYSGNSSDSLFVCDAAKAAYCSSSGATTFASFGSGTQCVYNKSGGGLVAC